ncbi:hypothetical protein Srot_2349 [Segniliparus rotundus DSM 44985]|uniref:Uncharacterized protein n=1 Tax=Segniliparus rotundus (strain ATCC BAA-972 / CDC 1076 / CIP 108378 / DSM 44985 / JCM 13578) TaxID=640132 RepID=D6ZAR1_SEGRD|nr:DUF6221 family protein [Segniliparus rotundus]ADG98797.1 hypothetical protein Srot_2349 [Segniliparus rotundus DSM 44985]
MSEQNEDQDWREEGFDELSRRSLGRLAPVWVEAVEFLWERLREDERLALAAPKEPRPTGCWGPERVLAECEAKRLMLHDVACFADPRESQFDHANLLQALLQPHEGHPDHRAGWQELLDEEGCRYPL